jgi:hypothetical protein
VNICIKNTFPTNHPFSGCVRLLIFLTLISPGSNISLARSSSFDLDHWHLVDALRKDQDLKSASPRGVVVYYGALRLCGFLCWLNRTVERDLVLPLDGGMGCYAYPLLQVENVIRARWMWSQVSSRWQDDIFGYLVRMNGRNLCCLVCLSWFWNEILFCLILMLAWRDETLVLSLT